MPSELDQLSALKKKHARDLMARTGVSGVGVEKGTDGKFRLTVHLDSAHPEVRDDLPDELEGHAIHYVWTGPFKPQSKPKG